MSTPSTDLPIPAAAFDAAPAPQGDLFGAPEPKPYTPPTPDPSMIRARFEAMLADLRASERGNPWRGDTLRLNRTLFPQMSNWLEPEERARLCAAFDRELDRLGLAG